MPGSVSKIVDPKGKSPDEILAADLPFHSSRHFYKGIAWLDYAERTKNFSALQYAALELRYGIEYLLFELLVLKTRGIDEKQYRDCIGDPKVMRRSLESSEVAYSKLCDFTRVAMSIAGSELKIRHWNLGDLFRDWGKASEFLHFMGSYSNTYLDAKTFDAGVARLKEILEPIWSAATTTLGVGLMDPKSMPPDVQTAWAEFSGGKLDEAGLSRKLRAIKQTMNQKPRGL